MSLIINGRYKRLVTARWGGSGPHSAELVSDALSVVHVGKTLLGVVVGEAVAAVLEAGVILLGPERRGGPGAGSLNSELVASGLDSEKSELAPVFSPGVSNHPVFISVL